MRYRRHRLASGLSRKKQYVQRYPFHVLAPVAKLMMLWNFGTASSGRGRPEIKSGDRSPPFIIRYGITGTGRYGNEAEKALSLAFHIVFGECRVAGSAKY